MVASSSNLLLVASTHAGHVRTGSTIPNDHDLTMTNFSNENRRGYMIRSTSTNNISGSSGNLKDMIMLETVAPVAFASAVATSAPASSITPTTKKSSTVGEEKQQRPRPRRKKMVSIGVDTMNKMLMTSSSNSTAVVVAMPESPTLVSRKHERACEQRDDDMEQEEGIFNIRSTSNRKILDFDMATPAMPDMLSMPAPALPTPAMNQNSKQKNEMSTMIPALPTPAMNRSSKVKNEMSNNDAPPMKKQMKKKQLHMGRRLRQIKKRLSASSKSGSQSSSKQEEADGHLSQGTSPTTSTSSLGQTASSQEEDAPPLIIDTMSMMTTTLKPRVRSMFQEGYEEDMRMMPSMPLPATPWSSPSPTTSTTYDGDGDGDGDAIADDMADDWGVFASIQDDDNNDDDEEEEDERESSPKYINFNYKSKSSSVRSSFTKITTNPCFQQPRARLPVFAATAGSE